MLGRVVLGETKRVSLCREELAGLYVQTASIPARKVTRRSVRRAAKLLCRSGAHRVLAPPDFLFWPELQKCGLSPVDSIPFLQAMAMPLALATLARLHIPPQEATVILVGTRVSRPLRDAALSLCPVTRQLIIQAPVGGTELAHFLRQEYGLPYLETCRAPQLALMFSDVEWNISVPVLRLYGPSPDLMGMKLMPKNLSLPEPCDSVSFLAALWEMGRLVPDSIEANPGEDT